jgi:hypothetical protein
VSEGQPSAESMLQQKRRVNQVAPKCMEESTLDGGSAVI